MRTRWWTVLVAVVAAFAISPACLYAAEPKAESPSASASSKRTVLDEVINHIISREHQEMALFSQYHPVVETYIQQLAPDPRMGEVPVHDAYYLGQADLSRGIEIRSMLRKQKGRFGIFDFSSHGNWQPDGFLQMIYLDRNGFDREHYHFRYAGRTFLGSVRCYMFDVTPKAHAGKGRFEGRIWVEDRDFTIVRFSGTYVPTRKLPFLDFVPHFDSWRLNVRPHVWLPAYVFVEGLSDKPGEPPRFKAQTRLWAYHPEGANPESEFSSLSIESDKQVKNETSQANRVSPIQEQREFDREAENNAIHTLVRAGLLAPKGPVDKVLDTVLNNLEVTNNIDLEPAPRCRVLLTSNIELFSIGHTIVLSRGLIDVLPDEPTLAVMLAEELSDAMIFKSRTSDYGFADVLQTSPTQALERFSFGDRNEDWSAIGAKALAILKNSPYKNKLGSAALFLKQLAAESKALPDLVGPHLGNRVYPIAALVNSGPALQPDKLDQIAALPMGSRVKLDPWNDDVEMMNSAPVAMMSIREKMPFEITPFMPFLSRYRELHATTVPSQQQQASAEEAQAGADH